MDKYGQTSSIGVKMMKTVQVLEQIEIFREKILALDEPYAFITAFNNKLSMNELYDFLNMIEDLSYTGVFDSELLSSIEVLTKNEHLERAITFGQLDSTL